MPTPLRVLILEDVLADAELMVHELRRAGFDPDWQRVETEAYFQAALDPALDLILADYNLPQFDALRALHRLQESGLDIPVIVISGTLGDEAAAECIKRGASDYLLKDRLARLGPAVSQAIEQHRLRREQKRVEGIMRMLYVASLEIQAPLELQDRLDRLLQTAQGILELDRLNVLLADSEGRWLCAVACLGVEEPLEALRVPIGPEGGGLAHAYLTKRPVIWDGSGSVPDELRLKSPYDAIEAFRSRVFAILPLVVEGRVIGVLGTDRKRTRRPLDAATLELLQLFTGQAALAIEHGRLYEAQRMAAIRLEATVEARTRDLQEAMLLLEAGSKHKSEFLANMSHELRTPLNSILGFSDLLRDQKVGPLTEKQARYVYNILESGQHLLTLINDLLDLSKVEAGKLELRPEVFNLREAIETALTGIRPQSLAKALELTLQVDEALSLLTADPVRFKQILLNLLSNAIMFTPKGGSITVTAKMVSSSEFGVSSSQPDTRHPKPETASASEFVEIAVADTGVGIRPEDLPKLFQPFTQLEGSFTKQYHGTGLGLALTKRLVESHGGTVRAESEGEGRGSTFTVRLPLTSQA